jgi:hypothetical protein
VFVDVFGYATLLSGDGAHDVMAKLYVPLPGSRRSFPDFALGFFRADQREAVVSAELKSPDADLDAPQGGGYAGKSPVQQAMDAATAADAEWCLVSNTNEVRLYRVPNQNQFERVYLMDVVSPQDFRRAHALLSRRSLLGQSETEPSPLSRFNAHVTKGENMLVPDRHDRIRLVQRVRPRLGDTELPFTRLRRAFVDALARVKLSGDFPQPRLVEDRLTTELGGPRPWQRVAIVKSGLLVCSYSIPLSNDTDAADQPIYVNPAEVLRLTAEMTAFAWKFFEPLTRSVLAFEWTLEDLSPRVRISDEKKWIRPCATATIACHANVHRTSYPEVTWSHEDGVDRATVAKTLGEVTRELLFPFEGNDEMDNRLCRLEPTDAEIKQVLDTCDDLAVFP